MTYVGMPQVWVLMQTKSWAGKRAYTHFLKVDEDTPEKQRKEVPSKTEIFHEERSKFNTPRDAGHGNG